MGRVVVMDTEVVVVASGGATMIPEGRERVLRRLAEHREAGDDLYLPAAALAECAAGLSEDILARLRIAPVDGRAALIAHRLTPEIRKIVREDRDLSQQPRRASLKVDAMILATAESLGADVLYVGEDRWFDKAAREVGLAVRVVSLAAS